MALSLFMMSIFLAFVNYRGMNNSVAPTMVKIIYICGSATNLLNRVTGSYKISILDGFIITTAFIVDIYTKILYPNLPDIIIGLDLLAIFNYILFKIKNDIDYMIYSYIAVCFSNYIMLTEFYNPRIDLSESFFLN